MSSKSLYLYFSEAILHGSDIALFKTTERISAFKIFLLEFIYFPTPSCPQWCKLNVKYLGGSEKNIYIADHKRVQVSDRVSLIQGTWTMKTSVEPQSGHCVNLDGFLRLSEPQFIRQQNRNFSEMGILWDSIKIREVKMLCKLQRYCTEEVKD